MDKGESLANGSRPDLEKHYWQLNRDVGRLVTAGLDLDEVLAQATSLLQSHVDYSLIGIWLLSSTRDEAVLRAVAGPVEAEPAKPGARLLLDMPSLIASVFRARSAQTAILPDGRAELALPLQMGGTVLGVLDVHRNRADAFGEQDSLALHSIADQLALAIRAARLVEAERQQRELAEALREAFATLATLDVEVVLDRLLEQVSRVVPNDRSNVMLVEGLRARTVRWRGYEETQAATTWLPIADTFTLRRMVETCQPIVISNTETDPNWSHCEGMCWGCSYAAVPICARGEVIGFLNVHSATPGFFDAAHAKRLCGFADGVAIALENARLYQVVQREKQYFESLVQNSPVAIAASDRDGHIVSWNPAAQRLFGYTQGEAIGRNVDELITQTSDMRAEAVVYTHQTAAGAPVHSVTQRYRKDGSRVDVELFSVPVAAEQARILAIYHDITELQRARQAAEAATRQAQHDKQYFEWLVQNSPVAIITRDTSGNVTSWNPAAEKLFGYSRVEAIGRDMDDLVTKTKDKRAEAGLYTQQTDEGALVHIVTQRHRRDGTPVDVEVFGVPVLIEGKRSGTLAIYHDVTELERARQQAEAANHAKSAFLAMMSHEIRTPLNAINGMASLLLDTALTSEQRDFANTIRASGEALLTIINDILDFSKIEAGRMELENQPFDVRQCIESALDLVAAKSAEKGLELAYLIEPDTPAAILGDVTRVRQVLVNLLTNAVKFTEQGEIVVNVAMEPEGGVGEHALRRLHFSVRDTGIGIPPDRMGQLFRPFTQGDVSTTRKYGGTGLGLAISKRLVEMMGGTIWVESPVPSQAGSPGCLFHFTIESQVAPGSTATSPGELSSLAGKHLLIVDDHPTSRQALVQQAQSWGMSPASAASGQEALELLRQTCFDAALLDLSLPDMDGLSLAAKLQGLENGDIPKILLAPWGWYKGEAEQEAGASCVLTKPIKSAPLRQALVKVLGGQVVKTSPVAERAIAQPEFDPHMGKRWPLRILVVEDHPTNQKLALLLLERLGYRADVVANGQEALQSLRRQHYDVTLMDVQMPEMDGLEASRTICREWPSAQRPRIIAMTASASDEDRAACLAAGMDDYITKPIRPAELIGALKRAIETVAPHPAQATGEPRAPEATASPSDVLDPEALQNLRAMLGVGFAANLPKLIGAFLDSAPKLMGELQQGIAQGQADQVRRAAHALKSSSATLGAASFSALCRDMESLGKTGDLQSAAARMARIESEYHQVRSALESLRQRAVENPGEL